MKKENLEMENKLINRFSMFVSSSYQKLLEFYFTVFDVNLSCFSIERSRDINGSRLRSNLKQRTDIINLHENVIGSVPLSKIMFLKSKFDKAGCTSIVFSRSIESYVMDGSRLRSNLKQYFDNHFFIKDVIGSGFNFAVAS